MRTTTLIIILLITLTLLSSCALITPKPKVTTYKCPDGRIVVNTTECEQTENLNTNTTPVVNTTLPAQTNTTGPQDTRNFSTLRRKDNITPTVTGTSYPNLNGWSINEIIEGMSSYEDKFMGIVASTITYNENGRTYALGTSFNQNEDPFWIARSPHSAGAKEYNINNFRVSLPQTPYEFYTMVEGKHNDSKFKIIYPEQWAEWDKIKCKKLPSCRTIEAIECTAGDHLLTMWTHNAPGAGYTESTRYSMQAVDDKKETLTTFEKFYCTPV